MIPFRTRACRSRAVPLASGTAASRGSAARPPAGRRVLLALLALLLATGPASAIDESDLLPVEQAFALTATATARDQITFRWVIADGYYLYRHRIRIASIDAPADFSAPQLPDGDKKHDEFFGDVETYRNSLTATVAGTPPVGARTLAFEVRSQGCADLGICYPPQKQIVQVTLPQAPAGAQLRGEQLPASQSQGAPSLGVASAGAAAIAAPAGSALDRVLGAAGAPAAARTDAPPLPPDQAFALEAIAGSPTELLLRLTPSRGYYLYRDRSRFALEATDGARVLAPRWPPGVDHRDAHFGDVVVYFDPVDVPLPLLREDGAARQITLQTTFQGCQTEGICYAPMTRRIQVALPAASAEQLAAARAAASTDPAQLGGMPPVAASADAARTAGAGQPASAPATSTDEAMQGAREDAPARTPPPVPGALGLVAALLLALGGGLVLNLMPCVLPVLSLKALSLAQGGANARAHALWYTAGVMVSFAAVGALALALRSAGLALGWGFQLQQPAVVAGLALVMLAIGLGLSGVVHVGAGLAGVGQRLTERTGPAGDFFTGVLAVVVASPCTAPLMGPALAYAFVAPPALALLVFLALGLGLALPFLLIGFVPALAARLPRPGAWMETLKQVLAFPMYLTAGWLVSVLASQRGHDGVLYAMVGATALALGLWWWERARYAPILPRALAALVVTASLWSLVAIHRLPPLERGVAAQDGSVAFAPATLAALRAERRVVFVNMTADWCVSCKTNEKLVFDRPAFRASLDAAGAAYVVGDYTDVSREITAFLETHRAVGVPLYVVYPADGGEGEVLPTLLTQGMVDAALRRAIR